MSLLEDRVADAKKVLDEMGPRDWHNFETYLNREEIYLDRKETLEAAQSVFDRINESLVIGHRDG